MQSRKLLYWIFYSALLPVLLVAATWLIEKFIMGISNPFAEMFGTGDLLPIATLLLLSVASDIHLEDHENPGLVDWKLVFHEIWFIIVVVMLVMTYGAMKVQGVQILKSQPHDGSGTLASFAAFSWVVMVYVIVHTMYVKIKLEDLVLKRTTTQ
jgi:hypothetical protein